jgi:hypothetical protein
MRKHVLLALMLLVAVAALAQEKTENKPTARNDFTWARSPYRLDFAVKELEDGKVMNTRTYSLVMQSAEERGRSFGEVRAGSRVPVSTTNKEGQSSIQYMDVGVKISSQLYVLESSNLLLGSEVEISTLATGPGAVDSGSGNPIVRSIRANTLGEIPSGKAAQIAFMDDPISKHRFQIEVTATKLR